MKTLCKTLLILSASIIATAAFCQDRSNAKALVARGVALNDSGKYIEAIAKYNEAIKADSLYGNAYYEMGYTLFVSGKEREAIPVLEKLLKLEPDAGGAYDMLGSIYDDEKQVDKAEEYYKQGIKVAPDYQRLYFNLGIMYQRAGKYKDAETYAISAIKLDPKHASSQRLYALATYSQDKRGVSLLAWCSFLLLEPQSKRSPEAFKYVEKIINYGIKQTDAKSVSITISPTDVDGANLMIPISVLAATTDKKGLSRVDTLALQLKSLFEVSDGFAGKKADAFYKSFFSDYFKALATSGNVPAFVRFVSISAYQEENVKWLKENPDKLNALDGWVTTTKREP